MVNIDLTTSGTAALNAANNAAGGILQAQQTKFQREMAQQDLDLAKRGQDLREKIANQELSYRERLLQDKMDEKAGTANAIDQYFKYRGRQFQYEIPNQTGSDTFFGDKFRSNRDWSADEMSKLEEHLTGQRNQVLSYANGLSPSAREAFLRATMPMLMADEEDERKGVQLRQHGKRATELMGSGLLDPEETAVAKQVLDQMGAGYDDIKSIDETLAHLTQTSQKRLKDQKTLEDGAKVYEQWKAQSPDGRDSDKVTNAYITWLASNDRTVDSLNRMVAAAKYKTHPDAVKIGRYELPPDTKPEVFRAISMKESMIEGRRAAMMDPEIVGMVGRLSKGEGEFDDTMKETYDHAVMKNQFEELQLHMSMMGYEVNPESFNALYPGFLERFGMLKEKIKDRSAVKLLKQNGYEGDPHAKVRIPTGPGDSGSVNSKGVPYYLADPSSEEKPKKSKAYDDPSRKFAPTHNPYAGGAPGG